MLRLEKLQKYHVQAIATDFQFLQSHRDAFCKDEVNGYVAMYKDIIAAIGGISLLCLDYKQVYVQMMKKLLDLLSG